MVRRQLLAVALAAVAAVVVAQPGSSGRGQEGGIAQPGSSRRGQEGGIMRISFSPDVGIVDVDPALSYSPAGWSLLDATCARLFTHPDTPSPASYRLQPEVAATYSVSKDLKTYTFRLRNGFRFSNREPVRASAFVHAINRVLQPIVHSPGVIYMRDIVGASDVLAGRAKKARGIRAPNPYTLVVRFSRPAPDFLERTTLPFFCAVPPGLPPSAEGVGKYPSAGPYYVTEYRKSDRIEIRRNPFYGGKRRVHVEGFDVDLNGGNHIELLTRLDRSEADWGYMLAGIFFEVPGVDFVKKYGRNGRFQVKPGLWLRMLAMNSARGLFHNNPQLRRAVNFALDRRAILAEGVGGLASSQLTDQHIPHSLSGFRDAPVYPFTADLERARRLARGHLRNRKAVLVVSRKSIVAGRVIEEQLERIGLDVEVDATGDDGGAAYWERLTTPGASWDLAYGLWTPGIPDAYAYLNSLVAGRGLGGESLTRVSAKRAIAALDRAVRLPSRGARDRAYAEADEKIARDVAPVAVLNVIREATLVSDRVDPDCMVLRPALDLAVACLRKGS